MSLDMTGTRCCILFRFPRHHQQPFARPRRAVRSAIIQSNFRVAFSTAVTRAVTLPRPSSFVPNTAFHNDFLTASVNRTQPCPDSSHSYQTPRGIYPSPSLRPSNSTAVSELVTWSEPRSSWLPTHITGPKTMAQARPCTLFDDLQATQNVTPRCAKLPSHGEPTRFEGIHPSPPSRVLGSSRWVSEIV